MPSADFSRFLAQRLDAKDIETPIKLLVELGMLERAAKGSLRDFFAYPWEQWLDSIPQAISEIIAVFILASRTGHDSSMLLMAEDTLFVHIDGSFWRPEILEKLRARTNRNLAKLRPSSMYFPPATAPRVHSVSEFAPIHAPQGNSLFDWLKSVPPATRSYFFYCDYRKTITTDYGLRCFGVDDDGDGHAILESGFFTVEGEEGACLRMLTKESFLKIGDTHGVPLRKGWTKKAIWEAICANPAAKETALSQTPVYRKVERNAAFETEWEEVLKFKKLAFPHCAALASL